MYENIKTAHIIARNLVVFCGVLAVLVGTAHAEVVCPSGSEISTAGSAETCVCKDGMPIQSIQPEGVLYCTSDPDNATFMYGSPCGTSLEPAEFTRLNVTSTCSPHIRHFSEECWFPKVKNHICISHVKNSQTVTNTLLCIMQIHMLIHTVMTEYLHINWCKMKMKLIQRAGPIYV